MEESAGRIGVAGRLRLEDGAAIWRTLGKATRGLPAGAQVDLDVTKVAAIDSTIAALLVELRATLAGRGVAVRFVGAGDALAAVVHLYGGDLPPVAVAHPRRPRAIARIGAAVAGAWRQGRRAVELSGELARGLGAVVRHPALGGWRELGALVARAGTDGIPIVLLLDFLIGFVMAYQSTRALQIYGANIYVADIVGVSITRELAPLITAVIVSGRSGAGYAAELGTMRVGEEIDALRTMGIAPVPYLVVPRILALALAAPVLALAGDLAGILGGLVVGSISLGVHPQAYVHEMRTIVVSSDVWTGLVKSLAFGIAIAVIGCQQGLATRGAASGVGRSTTRTVVACLFALVAIDTILTMVFREAGV